MAFEMKMDVIQRRRAQLAREQEERESGAHFDKLKEGPNRRRILPPWSAEGNWRKHAAYHYNVVDKKSLVCPKKTSGGKCPICEFVDDLYKTRTPDSLEQAKKYKAKDRFFANVLNLDLNDGKVYVMAFGPQLEESILDAMDGGSKQQAQGAASADQFGVGDITHAKTGRNLLVTKDVPPGHKEQTSYKAQVSMNASEVANWAVIEKGLHDLDAVVNKDLFSYEDLYKMLIGEATAPAPAGTAPAESTKPAAPAAPVAPAAGTTATSEFEKPNTAVDEFGRTPSAPPAGNTTPPPAQPAAPAAPATGAQSALEKLRAMKAAGAAK